VDAFPYTTDVSLDSQWIRRINSIGLCARLGWLGTCPSGGKVGLGVVEWVNPYPEKTIKHLDFFTPEMADRRGKRINFYAEAIIAITGVGVTEQDIRFWKEKKDRPPPLPAQEGVAKDRIELPVTPSRHELRGNWLRGGANLKNNEWKGIFSFPDAKVSYTARLMRDTGYYVYGRYAGVSINKGFFPFGVTIAFAKPIRLSSVDLSGPVHMAGQNQIVGISGQHHKVDVRVDISEDGKTWKPAGELKGISAEAGFLPVALPNTPIKGLRLIGNAKPYRLGYLKDSKYGLLSSHVSFLLPKFSWRFFAPKDAEKAVRNE